MSTVEGYRGHAEYSAGQLVSRFQAPPVESPQTTTSCAAPEPSAPAPSDQARMLIRIPAIGLTAPVLDNTDDTALDKGVGHVRGSDWPDQGGTDVVAAHNVTFFARLPQLRTGDIVIAETRCRRWTYRVDRGEIITAGDDVQPVSTPSLMLVTCWPINARYSTSRRYLVISELISTDTGPFSVLR